MSETKEQEMGTAKAETPAQTIARLQKENDKLAKANEKLKGATEELTEELKVKDATNGSLKPTVKMDGQYVQVQHAVKLKGGTVKSMAAIAADKDLCAELLRKGSSAVKVITTK